MILKINKLRKFLSNINNSNIDHININSKKLNITINKTEQKIATQFTKLKQSKPTINKLNDKIKNKKHFEENTKIHIKESEIYSTIVSPMVGTFYRSSAPNEPAFVEKNDIVQKKQIVCIIEAMKLMNEIEAEINGEIIEILVKDGDIVDCGQALIKIKNI
uniref:Biotin carboxyl carrier protein of acetyl-CoA carboxylase n=1 Tax=Spermothamnion repens TaxID=31383 RepID=A0A4D6WY39_9FLOR|nr:acetyl-CoA carboxylase, biotin carboxyl carrier protein [Spermothamnion repens]